MENAVAKPNTHRRVKVEAGRNIHVKGAKRRGDLLLIPFTKIEKVGEFIIVTE